MFIWMYYQRSPLWPSVNAKPFPWFIPPSQQDIYDLKDQIQDVEGRYMQGLKELKVEGPELNACLPSISTNTPDSKHS